MVFYALAAKFCNAFIWVILCRSQQHYRRKNMIEMIILIQFLLSLFLLSVLSCFVFFFFVHVLFSSNCCRFGIISVLYFRFEIYFLSIYSSWVELSYGWLVLGSFHLVATNNHPMHRRCLRAMCYTKIRNNGYTFK